MERLSMGDPEYTGFARIAGRLEFFAPFKGAEIDKLLSHIQLYGYKSGETVFRKGEPSNAFFIVYEGEVRIPLNRHWLWLIRRTARLGPGNLFGEMGLLKQRPRSATATATRPTQLFVMFQNDFQTLIQRNPAFAEAMQWIAARREFEAQN